MNGFKNLDKQLTSLDTMLHFSWADFRTTGKKMLFSLFLKNIQNGVGKFNCEAALVGFSTMLLMAHGQALHV